MFERMGLGDHLTVVSTLIQKMANNLRYWTEDIRVISATLTLFTELAWTYSSVKLLLTLDAVKHILTHHTVRSAPPPLSFCNALRLWCALLTGHRCGPCAGDTPCRRSTSRS